MSASCLAAEGIEVPMSDEANHQFGTPVRPRSAKTRPSRLRLNLVLMNRRTRAVRGYIRSNNQIWRELD